MKDNNFLNNEPVTDEELGFFDEEEFDSLDLLEQAADQAYSQWSDSQA